jgi:hypothetical protein
MHSNQGRDNVIDGAGAALFTAPALHQEEIVRAILQAATPNVQDKFVSAQLARGDGPQSPSPRLTRAHVLTRFFWIESHRES